MSLAVFASLKHLCPALGLALLILFPTILPAAPPKPLVQPILESRLRRLVGDGDMFPDLRSLVDLLNFMQKCGFGGELVRVTNSPDLRAPKMRGLYYVLRSASPEGICYSGRWSGLDNPMMREQLSWLVRSGTLVMVSLGSLEKFHSILLQPAKDDVGLQIANSLALDRPSKLVVILGSQFLTDSTSMKRLRHLSRDLMEILNFDLSAEGTMALAGSISRARNTGSLESAWEDGMVENILRAGNRRVLPGRHVDTHKLITALQPIRITGSTRREILKLAKNYFLEWDYRNFQSEFSNCSRYLQ